MPRPDGLPTFIDGVRSIEFDGQTFTERAAIEELLTRLTFEERARVSCTFPSGRVIPLGMIDASSGPDAARVSGGKVLL